MHPAFSVIFFTAISGTGYGLLFLLGLSLAFSPALFARNATLLMLALGALFAAAGLTSSLFHLGQPQRAWRALSQWRSSWLSREGVAAFASFVPIAVLAWCEWIGADPVCVRAAGMLLGVLAALTVYCTARIYTCLKTIHAWHNAYVLPGYLLLGLLGGASWLWLLLALDGAAPASARHALPGLVLALAASCAALKRGYWHFIDTTAHAATAASATGLHNFGNVRSAEAPHTEENYLTREMGFALARKHSARLRAIALILLAAAPVALALLALALHADVVFAAATALSVTAGMFVERWLFFAEARHVVMLYYGAERA